jgi:hypothetical protein
VEIKILLYIEYKSAGHYNHGEWWGTEIGKFFSV